MKQQILVVGLGRFGSAVARELHELGHEVMAVDSSERMVNDIAPHVTHALQLDASDEAALRAAGAGEFPHAIVSISSATDASIFAVMALKNLGVPNVIAKAANALHASILERVGASRVVLPEREMGERVAHTFAIPSVIDYLDLGPRFGIAKVRPPADWVGRTLAQLELPTSMKLTPIALIRGTRSP
jgi:trk system potassium uptake protein TrkA